MMRVRLVIHRVVAFAAVAQAALLGQQCTPTYSITGQETECLNSCALNPSYNPSSCPLCKWVAYRVQFPDGTIDNRTLTATGQFNRAYANCNEDTSYVYNSALVSCWPEFLTPVTYNGNFTADAYDKSTNISIKSCGLIAYYNWVITCTRGSLRFVSASHSCSPPSCPDQNCNPSAYEMQPDPCYNSPDPCPNGFVYESPCCTQYSPIIVDIGGAGFDLTSWQEGVVFDMNNDGVPERVAWTRPESGNALLVLDRNANGKIDNGSELFGDRTPQPPGPAKNGFAALAEFDKPENGGNGDGVIDRNDQVFAALRLWLDFNHNGISEAGELKALEDEAVTGIRLAYKETKWIDIYGNRFRFRSKVERANRPVGHWAFDVFLTVGQL